MCPLLDIGLVDAYPVNTVMVEPEVFYSDDVVFNDLFHLSRESIYGAIIMACLEPRIVWHGESRLDTN